MQLKPLPSDLIDSLFARLTVSYGAAFLRQYEGIAINKVKHDWAWQLRGFQQQDGDGNIDAPAVRYGLDHLPEKAVNVFEFRRLCQGYLSPTQMALPGPKQPVPERIRSALDQMRIPIEDNRPEDVRVAYRVIELHGHKRSLTPFHQALLAEKREVVERWLRAEEKRKAEEAAKQGVQA